MTAFAFYLLKVMICSGVLFLYYYLALRNKLFHQWNRFYLLAAIVISLIAPVVQVTIMHSADEPAKAIQMLQVFESAGGYLQEVTISGRPSMSTDQWLMMGYTIISGVFLISILISFQKVFSIIRSHTVQLVEKIKFINTNVKGTPFSFFNFIFWNEDIDLQTETGQQIFEHELVHVQEKHTIDKLFVQLVLIVFWCNPFFWLIRRELKLIHEFIADKKAVGEHGTAALAAMILSSSYPAHFNSLTNQFFQTSIKRRIAMLAKIQNPRINYLSRILAFSIIVFTVLAFTIRTKKVAVVPSQLEESIGHTLDQQKTENNIVDTVPQKQVVIQEITLEDPNTSKQDTGKKSNFLGTDLINPPLFILDGKEVTREEVNRLLASGVESISVLKGQAATEKYGQKGANGVVEIISKANIKIKEVTLELMTTDTVPRKTDQSKVKEIIVDGKKLGLSEIDFDKISWEQARKSKSLVVLYGKDNAKLYQSINDVHVDPSDIVSIFRGIGQPLVKEFGNNAVTGVIFITTKNYKKTGDEPIFTKVEIEASIDRNQWIRYLQTQLQRYIEIAASNGMDPGTYTIQVKFLVLKDGSVTDVKALNDPGFGLAEAAVKTVQIGPKWNPALQNGKPVNAYHTQPITFVIQEQEDDKKTTVSPDNTK
ncbi:MAG: energy transducer TonB [Flavisolibacter sp.]|nr:energy transducer TonB [Flavisolibacter sp.]